MSNLFPLAFGCYELQFEQEDSNTGTITPPPHLQYIWYQMTNCGIMFLHIVRIVKNI